MSPWHVDVLFEVIMPILARLRCPSRSGWIPIHGSAPELGSPLEQWDCAVGSQRQLGQPSGVPVGSLAGRRIYPGKRDQKMLLEVSGSSSCLVLASLSPSIHVISQ